MTKIFLYVVDANETAQTMAYALAEDGSSIMVVEVEHRIYAHQILTSYLSHRIYDEYYPEGYQLVDLTELSDEDLDNHKKFLEAFKKNQRASNNDNIE